MVVVTPRDEIQRVMRRIANGIQKGVSMDDFYSCRERQFGHVRWEIFKWLRAGGWSYPQIGGIFGQDHTSVMHGIKRSKDWPTTWVTEILNEERDKSPVFRATVARVGVGSKAKTHQNAVPGPIDGVLVNAIGSAGGVEHACAGATNREIGE